MIVEVLSESTEAYDRGEKFAHYRRLETLREYVLVAQNQPRIEHFRREGELREVLDFQRGHQYRQKSNDTPGPKKSALNTVDIYGVRRQASAFLFA
jgi:Uma2 family endonuclease